MSKLSLAQERLRNMTARAIEVFKDHQLVMDDREGGRWRIVRKREDGSHDGSYATEIISLWGSRLFVGGDIDDCVFAYYSGVKDEAGEAFHLNKLQWIGRCNDVGYYVAQKASIGLTDDRKLTWTYDQDVALTNLKTMLKDKEENWSAEDKEVIEEAIDLCDDGADEYNVVHCLNNLEDPSCIDSSLGRVLSDRVIYAWAACRRLCELVL